MPDYDLVISVRGKNEAGAVFDQLERSLRRIGETALGVIAARTIESIIESVTGVAVAAVNASSAFQLMQLNLASLSARELVQLSNDTKTTAEVFGQAEINAKGLMNQLARMSILSPYMLNEVSNTFRLNMAFGYTTAQAMKMTNGLLEIAAGIGADNEMLKRMAYNLAQVRQQGKVTALDVRQLALAGLDLEGALKWVSKQMGFTIKDHNDFNKLVKQGKITWEDFAVNFEKYADKYFKGSTERMARTMIGLKNTLLDTFNLTMPKLFLGTLDQVTAVASKLLDLFLYLYDSGVLDAIGAQITSWAQTKLDPILKFITDFVTNVQNINSYMTNAPHTWLEAFNMAFESAFGTDALNKLHAFEDVIFTIKAAFGLLSAGKWQDALKMTGVNWNVVDQISGFVDKVVVALKNLQTFWGEHGDSIIQSFKDLGSAIWVAIGGPDAGTNAEDALGGIGDGFVNATQWILDNGDDIDTAIGNFCDLLIEKIPLAKQAILDFGDAIEKKLPVIKELFGTIFKEIGDNPEKYATIGATLATIAGGGMILSQIDLSGPSKFFSILASLAVIASSGAFGALTSFLGGELATALGGLATAAGPVLLIALALGIIVGAILLLIANKDAINGFFGDLQMNIIDTANNAGWLPLVAYFLTLSDTLGKIRDVVVLMAQIWWPLFKLGAEQVGKAISDMLPTLKDIVFKNFGDAWKFISTVFDIFGGPAGGLQTVINLIAGAFTKALQGINGFLDTFIQNLKTAIALMDKIGIPGAWEQGSPSPMEASLMDINAQLDAFNAKMSLSGVVNTPNNGGNFTGGDSRIYNITINGGGSLTENDIIRALQKAGVSSI